MSDRLRQKPTRRRVWSELMEGLAVAWGMLIGSVIGFTLAVLVVIGALVCLKCRSQGTTTSVLASQRITAASAAASESNLGLDSPRSSEFSNMSMWLEALKKKTVVSACGLPKYSYGYVYCLYTLYNTRIGMFANRGWYWQRHKESDV